MLSKRVETMLVEQMNFEVYSAYIYLAMGAYFDAMNLTGFANWMKVQWQEELFHAKKQYLFILNRGGRPFYTAIKEPGREWDNPKAAFEAAYRHEQIVTDRINKIKTAAIEESDHATSSFMNWFVDEQVEEESNLDAIIRKLELIKSSEGLLMLDKELAARVFVEPPLK